MAANGEAFCKTLQLLWNPDEHIKTDSLEFVPPHPMELFTEHMMPVPAKIANVNWGVLKIAEAYQPYGPMRAGIPFDSRTLPPGEPIPEPKKTLDTYSRLKGRCRVLISHPNVCVNQSAGTPQKLTMRIDLDENFVPESWGWVKEPEPPLRTHENTSEAILLILNALQVIGVEVSELRVAGWIFTGTKSETFIGVDLTKSNLDDFVFTVEDLGKAGKQIERGLPRTSDMAVCVVAASRSYRSGDISWAGSHRFGDAAFRV